MKNPFARMLRARDKPTDAVSSAPTFYFGTSASGKAVNPSSAIQVSAVYACVRVIAETIASLPFHVYETTENGSRKAPEHPLYRLIHDEPNKEMTSFILRETMLAHLLLYGNAYCQIIRTGRDKIDSLYPLLPDKMEVDRDAGGLLTYTYTTSDGKRWRLEPRDVLHIPGLGFDGVMGYSPIALEKSAIGLGIAAEEYGSKFFSNGARPSGILTHPNTVKDPAALRASWNAAYRNGFSERRVGLVPVFFACPVCFIRQTEYDRVETRIDLAALDDVHGFLMYFPADGVSVGACSREEKPQRLLTGVTGALRHNIIKSAGWLGVELVKDAGRNVQTMLGGNLGGQHLIDAARGLIHHALGGRNDLDALHERRGLPDHIDSNIEYDGSLLAIRSTGVHFSLPLIVIDEHIEGKRGAELGLAVFLGDFDVCGVVLAHGGVIIAHCAENIPDNLLLPRKQDEWLAVKFAFCVLKRLDKACHALGFSFIKCHLTSLPSAGIPSDRPRRHRPCRRHWR